VISPDALERLLDALKMRLIDEVKNAKCSKCGKVVYYFNVVDKNWGNGHVPYYAIGDTVEVGFRCPESEDPIVIFKVSLGSLIKELKGERGTRYLE